MSSTLLPKHVAAVVKYQKNPLRALEMFNSVRNEEGFRHNLLTYKRMIEKLGFHGEFEAMERVLAELRMNVENSLLEGVYIGAMRSYGRKGKVQEAVDVFERMDFYNCYPSVQSYNAIMNILVEYGTRRPHIALRLLKNIPSHGCELNAVAYCTVASGFYEENFRVEAYELFDEMLRNGICPATYNIMIHAFSEKLQMDMSQKLFHEMIDNGCPPDNYTYRVMIDGFCKTDNVDSGYKFLLDKIEKGFIPALTTFGRVINSLCLKHKVREAVGIVHLMVRKGIVPDIVNTIFEADKKEVAAPKIVVEDLLKNSHIIYYAYELLYDGIRDKKLIKKKLPRSCANDPRKRSSYAND
ncbi:putative pentatricopeptide repeat-containing protein [Camellia lanceoleosa]|uniref:Pentatricopeptide repeat-containing protein n=1 Tax=Camellia lanceoleosa TaxID=1840588 RepID=A0ACC0F8E9_9ERIC|nr:putative pentatricopeptide repeat-containing protein [Camellia lanceoleosa]